MDQTYHQKMWHSQDFLRVVDAERVFLTHQTRFVCTVLAHVKAKLDGSDRGVFHRAIYPRASTETQGMYVTMCIHRCVYAYRQY